MLLYMFLRVYCVYFNAKLNQMFRFNTALNLDHMRTL
jgi:hypothetical protein